MTVETSGLQQPYCSANTIKTALVTEFKLEFSDLSTLCIGETSGRNIFEGLGLRVPGGQTDWATGHDEIKEMVTEMAELFFSFLTGDQGWQFKTKACKSFSSSRSTSSRSDQDFFTPNLWVCHPCLCSN